MIVKYRKAGRHNNEKSIEKTLLNLCRRCFPRFPSFWADTDPSVAMDLTDMFLASFSSSLESELESSLRKDRLQSGQWVRSIPWILPGKFAKPLANKWLHVKIWPLQLFSICDVTSCNTLSTWRWPMQTILKSYWTCSNIVNHSDWAYISMKLTQMHMKKLCQ